MHTSLPIAHLQRAPTHQKIAFFLLPAGSAWKKSWNPENAQKIRQVKKVFCSFGYNISFRRGWKMVLFCSVPLCDSLIIIANHDCWQSSARSLLKFQWIYFLFNSFTYIRRFFVHFIHSSIYFTHNHEFLRYPTWTSHCNLSLGIFLRSREREWGPLFWPLILVLLPCPYSTPELTELPYNGGYWTETKLNLRQKRTANYQKYNQMVTWKTLVAILDLGMPFSIAAMTGRFGVVGTRL